jgi:hypothetical protein
MAGFRSAQMLGLLLHDILWDDLSAVAALSALSFQLELNVDLLG